MSIEKHIIEWSGKTISSNKQFNDELRQTLERVRIDTLKKVEEVVKKEDEKWNGHGQYYANVGEALGSVLTHIQSLLDKKDNHE